MSEAEMMNQKPNKSLLPVLGILVVVAAGVYLFTPRGRGTVNVVGSSPQPMTANQSPTSSENIVTEEGVRVIEVTGANYLFNPATISVKRGETVRIVLTAGDKKHDLVIDDLNVRSDEVKEGETTTVEFVADRVGTFEYYCSVGDHRAMGMVGTLMVTE